MMGRRFGRRRKRGDDDRGAPIDGQWLSKAQETLGVESLERIEASDLPDHFALVARVAGEGGGLVAVSPRSGGDALLAAAAVLAREGDGQAVALAPSWDTSSRRRLSALVDAPEPRLLAGGEGTVHAESVSAWVPARRLADGAGDDAQRELFRRAAGALDGLAQKHGGALRSAGGALELVLLGRPVAALRAASGRVVLETLQPSRSEQTLQAGDLADAFDRLEGAARKRLNDRRVRDGEEGVRTRGIPALVAAESLRAVQRWPLGGNGASVDCIGVASDGRPVVGAVRTTLGLPELAAVLDGALAVEPLLALLLEEADAPLDLAARPRLVLSAAEVTPAAAGVLGRLSLPVSLYDAAGGGALRAIEIEGRAAETPAPITERAPEAPASDDDARGDESADESSGEAREEGSGRRRRRRRGRGRSRGRDAAAAGADDETPERSEPEAADDGGFEELSFLDLDEEEGSGERQSRGRRRRRRRRGGGGGEESANSSPEASSDGDGDGDDEDRSQRRRGKGRARRGRSRGPAAKAASGGDSDDEDDDLLQLADAPDFEAEVPAYEDDDGEPESEMDRIRVAREKRRRERDAATAAKVVVADGEVVEQTPEELPEPRGRAAILAHADRQSIAAAALLAREARHVEGVWVYPQEDLMTFFRGVATDLRDAVPIYVVGFAAKPARDVQQAAALYRGRLVWFDHHEWPPEDLGPMRDAVGENLLRLVPGAGSPLPAAVGFCTRRSRFSDKLVDLVTGRFSNHDFQRWGRLWWWRLGEIAKKTGDRRADLDLLLGGRPSDLAKEAERMEAPPLPEEVEYVAGRDLRLVHFGGLAMVEAVLPVHLDPHLTMRVARERYGAVLSLVRHEGSDRFLLGADDVTGRRAVDVSSMVEHLAEKFAWVDLLPDEDHVARIRVKDVETRPDRFDELVAEIGMSRSTLEG